MTCLEDLSPSQTNTTGTTCMVLDGAAIIQMMKPAAAKTYDEYAQEIFIPYISSHLRSVSRVDLVWDTYKHDSLKGISRVKHDKGVRRRVVGNGKGNQETGITFWGLTELFSFLSKVLLQAFCKEDKEVVLADGKGCSAHIYCMMSRPRPMQP